MFGWLRTLLGRPTASQTPTGTKTTSGVHAETNFETACRRISPAQILTPATAGTRYGFLQALAFLTLAESRRTIEGLRAGPFHDYLARTNADVIMFETAAFLFGSVEWLLEHKKEKKAKRQVTVAAMISGAMFEKFAGFEKAEEFLANRATRYWLRPTQAIEKFGVALVACNGWDKPEPVTSDGRVPVDALEMLSLPVIGMAIGTARLDRYADPALDLARKAAELDDTREDDDEEDEDDDLD